MLFRSTTLLLATDKPVVIAPAMNVRMWLHAATQRNVAQLKADGITVIDPDDGAMACGEFGPGRLPEPIDVMAATLGILPGTGRWQPAGLTEGPLQAAPPLHQAALGPSALTGEDLTGHHILVTAGPTHEPIDPVRVIANRSSGRQGFAIAAAAAAAGARVTLIAGPVSLPTPGGVARIDVETAEQMAAAVEAALPADVAILVAAVADWKVAASPVKFKKGDGPPALAFSPNPDILATLAASPDRPRLLIGFAAETNDLVANATEKRIRKGADWIIANDVSGDVMGGSHNQVHLITADGDDRWEVATKEAVAARLIARIIRTLHAKTPLT